MGSNSTGRIIAVLKLPEARAALVVVRARQIVESMTHNPAFPDPTPTLAEVSSLTDELHQAQVASLSRTVGAAALRNEKRFALVVKLKQLCAYVQAQADADPEHAASIIESAGMFVKGPRPYPARVFAAKRGPRSGTMTLVAPRAGRNATYEWAYRVVGAPEWTVAPPTVISTTTLEDLQPGAHMEFRYRVTTRAGTGDWSDPVRVIVD
jgi:hypothetical protein